MSICNIKRAIPKFVEETCNTLTKSLNDKLGITKTDIKMSALVLLCIVGMACCALAIYYFGITQNDLSGSLCLGAGVAITAALVVYTVKICLNSHAKPEIEDQEEPEIEDQEEPGLL